MFNIVKRRDFMLADDLPSREEAEQLRLDKYGKDHVVVITLDPQDSDKHSALNSTEPQL